MGEYDGMERVRRQLGLTKEYDLVGKKNGVVIAVLDSGVAMHIPT